MEGKMANKSTCSNCGNKLKDQWLVCKYCNQARWKMIIPYFAWGAVFLVGAWWAMTHRMTESAGSDNFIILMVPILATIFGIIGVVMLAMALAATLRGLSVRKVTRPLHIENTPVLHTTPPSSPAAVGTKNLNTSASLKSNQVIQPAQSGSIKQITQTIHCQKCKHENAPDAMKCSQCGTNLLPGAGIGQRFGVFGCTTILAFLSLAIAYGVYASKADIGGKGVIYLIGLVLFGVFVFGFGIIWSLRKTPPYERYAARAYRHVSLNPMQAIADYGIALNGAPQTQAFNFLLERAKLYQGLGMLREARTDWQYALENIDARMAKPKAPIELNKQRAELYKTMGMADEYALEMLRYTIEKEKTFKFKKDSVAMGVEEGFKKGTEDVARKELQKVRAEIMSNRQYRIVGQCKNCRCDVDLDARLVCTNNPKHRKIINIRPALQIAAPT